METYTFYIMCLQINKVLTVPMRNGNSCFSVVLAPVYACSYRTYEEWKLDKLLEFFLCEYVLTVPMRNGNMMWQLLLIGLPLVLTVPMRNGNTLHPLSLSAMPVVLTVPMRNGNYGTAFGG